MPELITFSLTLKETEAILTALSRFPYNEVNGIINSIQVQAAPQLARNAEPEKVDTNV
jgi:hypothetical protein